MMLGIFVGEQAIGPFEVCDEERLRRGPAGSDRDPQHDCHRSAYGTLSQP
jgi:hypothetical protein